MESICTELAHYSSKNECCRTDTVFLPISEVCDGTVSLVELYSANFLFLAMSTFKRLHLQSAYFKWTKLCITSFNFILELLVMFAWTEGVWWWKYILWIDLELKKKCTCIYLLRVPIPPPPPTLPSVFLLQDSSDTGGIFLQVVVLLKDHCK